jgi:hypothetical protein
MVVYLWNVLSNGSEIRVRHDAVTGLAGCKSGEGLVELAHWMTSPRYGPTTYLATFALLWKTWQTLPDLSPLASVRDLRELPESAVLP